MSEPPRATEPLTSALRAHVREGRITNLTTGVSVTFGRARTTIGADPRADVVVEDASMSRLHCEVRIVAATNRDLKAEVNAHRFRTDLYFRLAVLVITLPPLRERTGDIPALVEAILDGLGDRTSPMAQALASGELLPELLRHAWPGNVRELRNYVEACVVRQERAAAALTLLPWARSSASR